MKIAILICLSISSALITGCGASQHKQAYTNQTHTNKVAATEPENTVDSIQVATPEPQNVAPEVIPEQPKPIVRRAPAVPTPPPALAVTETAAVADVPVPAAPPAPPVPPPAPVVAEPKSNWIPNEVHLIRGNELISGLQRDIGRKPTPLEMQQRLQTHMGLTAPQAAQVIATLGLQ